MPTAPRYQTLVGVPTEGGVPPPAWVPAGWGYGVTKDMKEVPEHCTNIYQGIYHRAFL